MSDCIASQEGWLSVTPRWHTTKCKDSGKAPVAKYPCIHGVRLEDSG